MSSRICAKSTRADGRPWKAGSAVLDQDRIDLTVETLAILARPEFHRKARPKRRAWFAVALLLVAGALTGGAAWSFEPRHGIAMHGEPALGPDFQRRRYVDP